MATISTNTTLNSSIRSCRPAFVVEYPAILDSKVSQGVRGLTFPSLTRLPRISQGKLNRTVLWGSCWPLNCQEEFKRVFMLMVATPCTDCCKMKEI